MAYTIEQFLEEEKQAIISQLTQTEKQALLNALTTEERLQVQDKWLQALDSQTVLKPRAKKATAVKITHTRRCIKRLDT